jgi:hypothetical protein
LGFLIPFALHLPYVVGFQHVKINEIGAAGDLYEDLAL